MNNKLGGIFNMKKGFGIVVSLLLAVFFVLVVSNGFGFKTSVVFEDAAKERLELQNIINEKISEDTEVISILDDKKSYFVGVPVYEEGSKNIKDVNVVLSVDLSKWPMDVKEVSKTITFDTNKQDTVEHYNNLNAFLNYINDVDMKNVINPKVENILYIIAIIVSIFGAIYIPSVIANGLLDPAYMFAAIVFYSSASLLALWSATSIKISALFSLSVRLASITMFLITSLMAMETIRINKKEAKNL